MRRYKICGCCSVIRGSEEECSKMISDLCRILDDGDAITSQEDWDLKKILEKEAESLLDNILDGGSHAIILDDSGFAMCVGQDGSMFGGSEPDLLQQYK